MLERMSKVEDALAKIVSAQDNIMRAQDNNMAMIRSIEIQTRQLAKNIALIANGQSGQLVNNQTNPREVFLKKIYHILILFQKKR